MKTPTKFYASLLCCFLFFNCQKDIEQTENSLFISKETTTQGEISSDRGLIKNSQSNTHLHARSSRSLNQQRLVYWYTKSLDDKVGPFTAKILQLRFEENTHANIILAFKQAAWVISQLSPNVKINVSNAYYAPSLPPNVIGVLSDKNDNVFKPSQTGRTFRALFPTKYGANLLRRIIVPGNKIYINPYHTYNEDIVHLTRIAIHELLHTLGFAHTQDSKTYVSSTYAPIKRIPIRYYDDRETSIMEAKIMNFVPRGENRMNSTVTDLSNSNHNVYYYFKAIDLIAFDRIYGLHDAIKTKINQLAGGKEEIFYESFENGIPTTWTKLNRSWPVAAGTFYLRSLDGNSYAYSNYSASASSTTTAVINNHLISPGISLKAGDEINFGVKAAPQDTYADRYRLLITSEIVPPANPNRTTFPTTLIDYNPDYLTSGMFSTTSFRPVTFRLLNPTVKNTLGLYQISLNHYVVNTDKHGSGIGFDDFSITRPSNKYYKPVK